MSDGFCVGHGILHLARYGLMMDETGDYACGNHHASTWPFLGTNFCCFWDPRHDEESHTTDLPDIPASEHRRQNLDASRLRVREFRGRRSIAGQQTGIEVSQVLLMGGIKKWAAPWMCWGPI
ncbi:hypothetical protein ALC53_08554 [Atta colombica]|uniref:Uncharacterized protein n=1 Tax=Atta colombica TaxID=520822 RepID=A0A151I277_9HYME|nr:hypothetical protein ALC53_08554 [Atta colombica]